MYYFILARSRPDDVKAAMIQGVQAALGAGFDVETHFTPRYNPWDQRVCLVPDSDLFNAINAGKVSVVTDQIDTFVENGLRLKSGQTLTADIIVTATGLVMKIMNSIQIVVDGSPVDLSDTVAYKGLMYSNIPNLASAFGYTNASWTLKAELICEYVCRLLNYMDRHGYRQCVPRINDPSFERDSFIDFTAGYVQRARSSLPQQGKRRPWRVYQNYLKDVFIMRFSPFNDGAMDFK
jgi:cation diffusion facilitator CzcD-associated flavoprotein CzcO